MVDGVKLRSCGFAGPLADELQAFLSLKRSTGHKYVAESYYLDSIDKLSVQMDKGTGKGFFTKEFADTWTQKKKTESHKTWGNRIVVIRQFAHYLKNQGIPAYEPTLIVRAKHSNFVPHIYTDSELRRIFEQSDKCPAYTNCPKRNAVAALIFRMVYSCGLRISEALNLNICHVDLENGVLTISESKFGVNRYVPISVELANRCRAFMENIHPQPNPSDVFFPAPDGGRYSKRAITHMFHQILCMAGISRTKRSPRIHDFRHTFAVNCLKKWVCSEKDLTIALPVLSAYLGHKSLKGTQGYLRLTADMFPNITSAVEAHSGNIIPSGGVIFEE
jgi:integrase